MSFVLTLLSIALVAGFLYVQACRTKNRVASTTWDELVRKLEEVPLTGITRVALDYLQPVKGQLAIQTNQMWMLVGEAEGLRRMKANAQILLQLSALAQQWNFEEAIIVGERMRREALVLRRAVNKVQRRLFFGYGRASGPFYVQEAAGAYYLMRRRLLALYETVDKGRHCRLSIALGNHFAACGPAI